MDSTPGTVAQTSRPLDALLEASALLLASRSEAELLSGILDLAGNVISADSYALWRTRDSVNWRAEASRGLPPGYRTEMATKGTFLPRFEAIPDVMANDMVGEYRDLYQRFGIQSMLIVPLQLRNGIPDGPNSGTLTFYWKAKRNFTQMDIAYASALANLSSAAINLAELNEQNKRERMRLTFLAEASTALASSLEYETTLERVAQLAVPQIADWCTVHIMENGVPNRIVVAHSDPEQLSRAEEFSRRYPERMEPGQGLGYVLRTGKSEFYPHITEAMVDAAARDEEHLRLVRELRLSGSILVPLRGHDDTVLGAIRLLATGERRFRGEDLRLAEDLALRAGASIENAKLHRELQEQEKRLRLAHSAAHMGTWGWDLARNELAWSDEWKRLHGLPLDVTPSAEGGESLVHPEDRAGVLDQLRRALESTDDLVVFEHRVLTGDGRTIWVHHRARIERDSGGTAVSLLGISMDITERRQAEDVLRRTEKLATAGRLAATVAHEINNPLESIVNLVYIAKMSPGTPPEIRELLTTAEGELNRTAQIVRQTLGFYREAVHPQRTDVGQVVSEILDLYRTRIQARALVYRESIAPGIMVNVIPGELKQVVANLISNSIDATGLGGAIEVRVAKDGENASVTVRDTGTGIDAAHLTRLFEPFFTTKEDVGTGLGLWVSKGIAEKHGGRIDVATSTGAEDHGTAFTISLPLD